MWNDHPNYTTLGCALEVKKISIRAAVWMMPHEEAILVQQSQRLLLLWAGLYYHFKGNHLFSEFKI